MPRLPSKFPLRIFFLGGGYSTQAPTEVPLGPRLSRMIASVIDPPLMSVRAADIPGASALAVTETVTVLTSVLPVMAVAILSVWAAHCTLEVSPVHESASEVAASAAEPPKVAASVAEPP